MVTITATEGWIDALPHSRMVYPEGILDRMKYWFWRVYGPIHPLIRNTSTALGFDAGFFGESLDENGRQDFLIGTLHPERTLRDFAMYLVENGFANHFVAWKDSGEVISLRKTVGFHYQYHIRVFGDGEVRCHYEYTPEYRPLQHLLSIGLEDRREEFRNLMQEWVVPIETA